MTVADRPWLLAAAAVYLLVVMAIGAWSARRTRTPRDFWIAGQGIGLGVTGLATMSAAFSGFVFLGGPGLTYRLGLGSLMIVLPVGFTAGMLCWVVGGRLRALAASDGVYTVPDALALRFGRRTAGLAALAVAAGSVAYLGLQFQAIGILARTLLGIDSAWAATCVGIVVLVTYAVVGGMVAGVYTDVVQGGLMLVAAAAVFVHAVGTAGGWSAMLASIAGSERFGPAFLDPVGRTPAMTALGFFFVFGIGVLGQPQMLHKFYMIDDPRKLRLMPLVLGGGQALCLLIWIGVGLAVPALVAQGRLAPLAVADDAAPAYLLHFAPGALAGLVVAGILAAIMSTADSFLNIGAAALVRDLPRAAGRRVADELFWGRLAVVAVGGAAALLAWAYQDLIALLGAFAFGTFAAALAPALAVGLHWDRVGPRAASASI